MSIRDLSAGLAFLGCRIAPTWRQLVVLAIAAGPFAGESSFGVARSLRSMSKAQAFGNFSKHQNHV